MRHILLTILLLISSLVSWAQSSISGVVTDQDGKAVDLAQLVLRTSSDSTLVASVSSQPDGAYTISRVPKGSYILTASFFNAKPVTKRVMIFSGSNIKMDFVLNDEGKLLDELVVVSTGIQTSGDTTTYQVNRFVTGREKNLREVMEALPRVSISQDNRSVTVDGKQVRRILIENNDLFQGNVAIPLENLGAKGIRKVEVIDNYSEYNIFDGFQTTNETVINLNVSDEMKQKLSVELSAAGGIMNRYEGKNNSLYIGRKSMFSGILSANNVGKQLLSFQDVIGINGGYNTILSSEDPVESVKKTIKMYAPFMDSGREIFERNSSLLSLNYLTNPSKKAKLMLSGIVGVEGLKADDQKSYDYFSGLSYQELTSEHTRRQQALLNGKVQITPTSSTSILYSGTLLGINQNRTYSNRLMAIDLDYLTKPQALNSRNNLLLTKRIGEKNNLSLSLDYNENITKSSTDLNTDQALYTQELGLQNSFLYTNKTRDQLLSAELFYLHRLHHKYFYRVGYRIMRNHLSYSSLLRQERPVNQYNNESYLNYLDHNIDLRFSKDRGKLTYTAGLGLKYVTAQSDLERNWKESASLSLAPSVKLKYAISMSQNLSLSYDYDIEKYQLGDLLTHRQLAAYNRVIGSRLEELFSHRHRVMGMYVLTLPFSGFTFANVTSYEAYDKSIADDLSLVGAISVVERRLSEGRRTLNTTNSAEYKVIGIPLNIKLSLNYMNGFQPSYYSGVLYETTLNSTMLQLLLTTHYKKGFNGKVEINYGDNRYSGLPINNKMNRLSYLGEVTWHNGKFSIKASAEARHYFMDQYKTEQLYLGFEAEYKLTNNFILSLRGADVANLEKRTSETSIIDNYYSVRRVTREMPGHIVLGLRWKY